MLMGRQNSMLTWMEQAGIAPADSAEKAAALHAARGKLRNSILIFRSGAMMMFPSNERFHRNPDQDLNKLWWDLVEKYQEVHG